MKTITNPLVISFFALLTACATPYQPGGFRGGYSETQLQENVFQVFFRGNGYTRKERASDLALLRAAELTLANGYRYFVTLDGGTDTLQNTSTTLGRSHTYGQVDSRGNFTASTQHYGGRTTTVTRHLSSLTIACFVDKPADTMAYDAEFLSKSLRKKYNVQ